MGRLGLTGALCLSLALSACDYGLSPPRQAAISCSSDAQCPQSQVCALGAERCVAPESPCVERQGEVFRARDNGSPCTGDNETAAVCVEARCVPSQCGDGVLDVRTEQCDQGPNNSAAPDAACRPDCTTGTCGDGILDSGEQCDDGNDILTDACVNCRDADCGDGLVWSGKEECDDGNSIAVDACIDCERSECGDGIVKSAVPEEQAEACDDGNDNPNDRCNACQPATWKVDVLTGRGPIEDEDAQQPLGDIHSVAVGPQDQVYLSSESQNRVYRVDQLDDEDADATVTVIAGGGTDGFDLDGIVAVESRFNQPKGLAVDAFGNIYVADFGADRVRRIDARTSIVTTIAGGEEQTGVSGDDGAARNAGIGGAREVAVDPAGNVYVLQTPRESESPRVRRIDADDNTITTLLGGGNESVAPTSTECDKVELDAPRGLAFDAEGRLWLGEKDDGQILRADFTLDAPSDCQVREVDATFAAITALTILGDSVYVSTGEAIRRFPIGGGTIERVAGPASGAAPRTGYTGDDVAALGALLDGPSDLAVAADANSLLIADRGNRRLRRLTLNQQVQDNRLISIAGAGQTLPDDTGMLATSARLYGNVALDVHATAAAFYFTTTKPEGKPGLDDDVVYRVVRASGRFESFAGDDPNQDEGASADAVELRRPHGLASDTDGTVYIAEREGYVVREVDAAGATRTIAGTGTAATDSAPDSGNALSVPLRGPQSLVRHGRTLFILDCGDACVIRALDLDSGTVSPYAGSTPSNTGNGDGGPAANARFDTPVDLAVDSGGNLYVADAGDPNGGPEASSRVRRIGADSGEITTVAGAGATSAGCDVDNPADAGFDEIAGIAIDADDRLFITDRKANRLCQVSLQNNTIAEASKSVSAAAAESPSDGAQVPPDGVRPTETWHFNPGAADADASGVVVFNGPCEAQEDDQCSVDVSGRFRFIAGGPSERVISVAGAVDPPGQGPLARARIQTPQAIEKLGPKQFAVANGIVGTVSLLDLAAESARTVAGRRGGLRELVSQLPFKQPARYTAAFAYPAGLAYNDKDKSLYLSQRLTHVIDELHVSEGPDNWQITQLAGQYAQVGGGFGAESPLSSTDPLLHQPLGLALGPQNKQLYVADSRNHVVRRIDLESDSESESGSVHIVAGEPGQPGFSGDGGPATAARLSEPQGVAVGPNGDIYIADTYNHRVRRIQPDSGVIQTVTGTGVPATSGEGAPARNFPIDTPRGMAVDTFGNLFVASASAVRVVTADATSGIAKGSSEVLSIFAADARGSFEQKLLGCLTDLSLATPARVLVVDGCAGVVFDLEQD